MKKFFNFSVCVLFIFMLIGCNTSSHPEPFDPALNSEKESNPSLGELTAEPEEIIKKYFHALINEDYKTLVDLYGGSYDTLRGYNKLIDPEDYEALMTSYCTKNGGQIVQLSEMISKNEVTKDEYLFELTLKYADNSPFLNGQTVSYTVKKQNGVFKVMELPPYLS